MYLYGCARGPVQNQNNYSTARPLVRACDLEVRSRPPNTNVGVKYGALLQTDELLPSQHIMHDSQISCLFRVWLVFAIGS